MPKVSIIIATYRRPEYLKLTIENIHRQTFSDFEVIVVDDGTPGDENETICTAYSDLVYLKIPNSGGPMVPRNVGMRMAKGKYIAIVDDDDLWVTDKLERQVAILDNESEYGLVHGCCKVIDNLGNETGEIVGRLRNSKRKHGYVFDDMVGNFTVMMPTSLFRRELINLAGEFNQKMQAAGEDMEFFSRIAFYTKFYYIEEPIAWYRIHPKSISKNNYSYNYLPLALYKMVKDIKHREHLDKTRFRAIRNRLLLQQVALVNDARTFKTAFFNSAIINPFFWLYPRVVFAFFLRIPAIFKSNNKEAKL